MSEKLLMEYNLVKYKSNSETESNLVSNPEINLDSNLEIEVINIMDTDQTEYKEKMNKIQEIIIISWGILNNDKSKDINFCLFFYLITLINTVCSQYSCTEQSRKLDEMNKEKYNNKDYYMSTSDRYINFNPIPKTIKLYFDKQQLQQRTTNGYYLDKLSKLIQGNNIFDVLKPVLDSILKNVNFCVEYGKKQDNGEHKAIPNYNSIRGILESINVLLQSILLMLQFNFSELLGDLISNVNMLTVITLFLYIASLNYANLISDIESCWKVLKILLSIFFIILHNVVILNNIQTKIVNNNLFNQKIRTTDHGEIEDFNVAKQTYTGIPLPTNAGNNTYPMIVLTSFPVIEFIVTSATPTNELDDIIRNNINTLRDHKGKLYNIMGTYMHDYNRSNIQLDIQSQYLRMGIERAFNYFYLVFYYIDTNKDIEFFSSYFKLIARIVLFKNLYENVIVQQYIISTCINYIILPLILYFNHRTYVLRRVFKYYNELFNLLYKKITKDTSNKLKNLQLLIIILCIIVSRVAHDFVYIFIPYDHITIKYTEELICDILTIVTTDSIRDGGSASGSVSGAVSGAASGSAQELLPDLSEEIINKITDILEKLRFKEVMKIIIQVYINFKDTYTMCKTIYKQEEYNSIAVYINMLSLFRAFNERNRVNEKLLEQTYELIQSFTSPMSFTYRYNKYELRPLITFTPGMSNKYDKLEVLLFLYLHYICVSNIHKLPTAITNIPSNDRIYNFFYIIYKILLTSKSKFPEYNHLNNCIKRYLVPKVVIVSNRNGNIIYNLILTGLTKHNANIETTDRDIVLSRNLRSLIHVVRKETMNTDKCFLLFKEVFYYYYLLFCTPLKQFIIVFLFFVQELIKKSHIEARRETSSPAVLREEAPTVGVLPGASSAEARKEIYIPFLNNPTFINFIRQLHNPRLANLITEIKKYIRTNQEFISSLPSKILIRVSLDLGEEFPDIIGIKKLLEDNQIHDINPDLINDISSINIISIKTDDQTLDISIPRDAAPRPEPAVTPLISTTSEFIVPFTVLCFILSYILLLPHSFLLNDIYSYYRIMHLNFEYNLITGLTYVLLKSIYTLCMHLTNHDSIRKNLLTFSEVLSIYLPTTMNVFATRIEVSENTRPNIDVQCTYDIPPYLHNCVIKKYICQKIIEKDNTCNEHLKRLENTYIIDNNLENSDSSQKRVYGNIKILKSSEILQRLNTVLADNKLEEANAAIIKSLEDENQSTILQYSEIVKKFNDELYKGTDPPPDDEEPDGDKEPDDIQQSVKNIVLNYDNMVKPYELKFDVNYPLYVTYSNKDVIFDNLNPLIVGLNILVDIHMSVTCMLIILAGLSGCGKTFLALRSKASIIVSIFKYINRLVNVESSDQGRKVHVKNITIGVIIQNCDAPFLYTLDLSELYTDSAKSLSDENFIKKLTELLQKNLVTRPTILNRESSRTYVTIELSFNVRNKGECTVFIFDYLGDESRISNMLFSIDYIKKLTDNMSLYCGEIISKPCAYGTECMDPSKLFVYHIVETDNSPFNDKYQTFFSHSKSIEDKSYAINQLEDLIRQNSSLIEWNIMWNSTVLFWMFVIFKNIITAITTSLATNLLNVYHSKCVEYNKKIAERQRSQNTGFDSRENVNQNLRTLLLVYTNKGLILPIDSPEIKEYMIEKIYGPDHGNGTKYIYDVKQISVYLSSEVTQPGDDNVYFKITEQQIRQIHNMQTTMGGVRKLTEFYSSLEDSNINSNLIYGIFRGNLEKINDTNIVEAKYAFLSSYYKEHHVFNPNASGILPDHNFMINPWEYSVIFKNSAVSGCVVVPIINTTEEYDATLYENVSIINPYKEFENYINREFQYQDVSRTENRGFDVRLQSVQSSPSLHRRPTSAFRAQRTVIDTRATESVRDRSLTRNSSSSSQAVRQQPITRGRSLASVTGQRQGRTKFKDYINRDLYKILKGGSVDISSILNSGLRNFDNIKRAFDNAIIKFSRENTAALSTAQKMVPNKAQVITDFLKIALLPDKSNNTASLEKAILSYVTKITEICKLHAYKYKKKLNICTIVKIFIEGILFKSMKAPGISDFLFLTITDINTEDTRNTGECSAPRNPSVSGYISSLNREIPNSKQIFVYNLIPLYISHLNDITYVDILDVTRPIVDLSNGEAATTKIIEFLNNSIINMIGGASARDISRGIKSQTFNVVSENNHTFLNNIDTLVKYWYELFIKGNKQTSITSGLNNFPLMTIVENDECKVSMRSELHSFTDHDNYLEHIKKFNITGQENTRDQRQRQLRSQPSRPPENVKYLATPCIIESRDSIGKLLMECKYESGKSYSQELEKEFRVLEDYVSMESNKFGNEYTPFKLEYLYLLYDSQNPDINSHSFDNIIYQWITFMYIINYLLNSIYTTADLINRFMDICNEEIDQVNTGAHQFQITTSSQITPLSEHPGIYYIKCNSVQDNVTLRLHTLLSDTRNLIPLIFVLLVCDKYEFLLRWFNEIKNRSYIIPDVSKDTMSPLLYIDLENILDGNLTQLNTLIQDIGFTTVIDNTMIKKDILKNNIFNHDNNDNDEYFSKILFRIQFLARNYIQLQLANIQQSFTIFKLLSYLSEVLNFCASYALLNLGLVLTIAAITYRTKCENKSIEYTNRQLIVHDIFKSTNYSPFKFMELTGKLFSSIKDTTKFPLLDNILKKCDFSKTIKLNVKAHDARLVEYRPERLIYINFDMLVVLTIVYYIFVKIYSLTSVSNDFKSKNIILVTIIFYVLYEILEQLLRYNQKDLLLATNAYYIIAKAITNYIYRDILHSTDYTIINLIYLVHVLVFICNLLSIFNLSHPFSIFNTFQETLITFNLERDNIELVKNILTEGLQLLSKDSISITVIKIPLNLLDKIIFTVGTIL